MSSTWSNRDKIDQKIIEILNENARTSSKEIAIELRKEGNDVSDRTVRKRIERLEKSGIIKGYKAVLSDVLDKSHAEALFIKFKITKSVDIIKNSVKTFVSTIPNYLFTADLDGDWNMLIVLNVEDNQVHPTSKIIEKFSDNILDYKTNSFHINDINLLNMSTLLF